MVYSMTGYWVLGDVQLDEGERDITLPEDTRTVGKRCFKDNTQLRTVVVPEGVVEISWEAFSGSSVEKVVLPESLKMIRSSAFKNCKQLKEIVLPSGLEKLYQMAFMDCKKLKSIEIPPMIDEIPKQCFQGCSSLKRLVLPQSLDTIMNDAFNGCRTLEEIVTSPDSSFYIDSGAFENTLWLLKHQENAVLGKCIYRYDGEDEELVIDDNIRFISPLAFWYGGDNMRSLVIPSTVRKIGNKAFWLRDNLEKVVVGAWAICDSAFEGCGIKELTLLPSVTSIGDHAFANIKITHLTIPDRAYAVHCNAFHSCMELLTVTIDRESIYPECCFHGCYKLYAIMAPSISPCIIARISDIYLDDNELLLLALSGYILMKLRNKPVSPYVDDEYAKQIRLNLYRLKGRIYKWRHLVLYFVQHDMLEMDEVDYVMDYYRGDTEIIAALLTYKQANGGCFDYEL